MWFNIICVYLMISGLVLFRSALFVANKIENNLDWLINGLFWIIKPIQIIYKFIIK